MAADYYAILKNAIGALPETSGEARRAVYEKARRAVVDQLKAFDPPLSATEITQERLRLEDCIRRVEAEAAKGILTQTLSGRAPTQVLPAPPPREVETRTSRPPFEPPTRAASPTAAPAAPFAERATSRTYPQPVAPEPPTARWDRPERSNPLTGERLSSERNRLTTPTGGLASDRRNTGLGTPATAQQPATPLTSFGAQPAVSQPPVLSPRPAPGLTPSQFEPPTAALRLAAETSEQLGAAVVETAEHTRNILLAGAEADAYSRREPSGDTIPTAITGAPPRDMNAESTFGDAPRSKKPMIIGISAGVVVLAIGAGALWSQKDNIAAFFGDQRVGLARNGAAGVPPKSTDRLTSEDQPGSSKSDVKKVQAESITVPSANTSAPEPSTNPPPSTASSPVLPPVAQPVPTAGPSTDQAIASAPPQQQPVPMVAQRVSMMEENPVAGSQPIFSSGKVVWQTVKENQPGKPPVNVLRARVEIPDRRITMTLSMQPNTDATFSASHLVEVRFSVPGDFDAKGIANVPGIIMKPNEQATGSPLVGASAKISQNFFWFALAAGDADKQRNLALLKDSGWMAIPVVYDTGKRGLITIEKAGAGDRAVSDALATWQ